MRIALMICLVFGAGLVLKFDRKERYRLKHQQASVTVTQTTVTEAHIY